MPKYHLAQINIVRMLTPVDDSLMTKFTAIYEK